MQVEVIKVPAGHHGHIQSQHQILYLDGDNPLGVFRHHGLSIGMLYHRFTAVVFVNQGICLLLGLCHNLRRIRRGRRLRCLGAFPLAFAFLSLTAFCLRGGGRRRILRRGCAATVQKDSKEQAAEQERV